MGMRVERNRSALLLPSCPNTANKNVKAGGSQECPVLPLQQDTFPGLLQILCQAHVTSQAEGWWLRPVMVLAHTYNWESFPGAFNSQKAIHWRGGGVSIPGT